MWIVQIMICLVIGYVFGCFSSGYMIGKMNGIDIRAEGSGNLGTTNALRTLGAKAGLLTFIGDILKGVIPIIAARIIIKDADLSILLALYIGLGVVLGHNYPFWLHFHGGKGIAVTAAVILSIADWKIIILGLLLFIIIVAITRYVSVGSLAIAWLLPINVLLFQRDNRLFVHILVLSLCFTALAYKKHWSNIKRLRNGTENKFVLRKNKL